VAAQRSLVLVTGASGGIGLELAHAAAADGHDLVLVARHGDTLEQAATAITDRYPVAVQTLACDLALPDGPARVAAFVADRPLHALVNNAGYGAYGRFADADLDDQLGMIDLNARALTELTHRVLGGMIARRSGVILNVASTAAFFPGPLMAVYYATKHYVVAFSEALAEELARTGVHVSVLCPGPTATGFQERAAMQRSRLVVGWRVMDATEVAARGWAGAKAGRRIVIPGRANAASVLAPRILPRRALAWVVARAQRPVDR
jgi:uncharacterized protein